MVIRSLRREPASGIQRRRVLLLLAGAMLWSTALLGRLVHLQVLEHEWFEREARRQQTAVIQLPARRGDIFTRDGQTLATSVALSSIYAHPDQVTDPRVTAELLAPALQRPFESVLAELSSAQHFVYLRRQANPDIEAAVREAIAKGRLRGIGMHPDSKRYYPQRSLAAHVTGFVNIDNVGQAGVELSYDDLIRGEKGSLNTLKDGRRHLIGGRSWALTNPTRGHDVVLTLDWALQYTAETAIRRAVRAKHARGGSIVALDPRSGEILAMASYPSFNPNVRNSTAFRNHQTNQVVDWRFEPGSMFKVITAAAALHEGVVSENEPIDCQGGQYPVANHVYRDWKLGFGVMPFRDVLANSSNVGTIKVCQRLSPETYYSWLRDFGFGSPTGIDLPSEEPGSLSSPEHWSKLTQASMAFGQEIGSTPIQLATAVATIANGGMLVTPHVLQRVRTADGKKVDEVRLGRGRVIQVGQTQPRRRVLRTSVAERMALMMEHVVADGTGKTARIPGYRVAGKTSTAQKIDPVTGRYTKYVAGFIGFLPVSDPRILILVVVDEPQRGYGGHGGSAAAAPAFRELALAAIRVLRLAPDERSSPSYWMTGLPSPTGDRPPVGGTPLP